MPPQNNDNTDAIILILVIVGLGVLAVLGYLYDIITGIGTTVGTCTPAHQGNVILTGFKFVSSASPSFTEGVKILFEGIGLLGLLLVLLDVVRRRTQRTVRSPRGRHTQTTGLGSHLPSTLLAGVGLFVIGGAVVLYISLTVHTPCVATLP